jgi:hypothetical protein
MDAASTVFPSTVIQHEDFYSEAAFDFLERYQNKYRMFNDDIQGYVISCVLDTNRQYRLCHSWWIHQCCQDGFDCFWT